MLRFALNRNALKKSLLNLSNNSASCHRLQSTNTSSSSVKVGLIVGSAVILGGGGVVAYANYDKKFRKSVEDTIPQSDTILNLILGPADKETNKIGSNKLSQSSDKSIEGSVLKKRLEREKSSTQPTGNNPGTQQKPSVPAPSGEKTTPSDAGKQREVEAARRTASIRQDLQQLITKVEEQTKNTISAQRTAIEAIRQHTKLLTNALDANSEDQSIWDEVSSASLLRTSSTQNADAKLSENRLEIENLRKKIDAAKADKDASSSSIISQAEETVTRLLYQLENSENDLSSANNEAKVAEHYKEVADEGRKQFEKELKAILPEGSKFAAKKFNDEEINILLAHAHKKVKQLNNELAKQKAVEETHIRQALALQQEEDDRVSDTRIALELQKRRSELESDYQKKINRVRDELEEELRVQLKRQLAAHQDHLQEQLQVRTHELNRRHQLTLEDTILLEASRYQSELSDSLNRLQTIEAILKVRDQLDKEERAAKELWLVCQVLRDSLKRNQSNLSGESVPRPLNNEITAVKETLKEFLNQNPLAKVAIESIPADVLREGVYTEDELIKRFATVDRVCRRVALVNEGGDSLFKYLLSYVQSLLIIGDSKIPQEELEDQETVDPSKWDTFDILSRVKHSLRNNNLEMALRYANQLRGEPRNVATDWIRDTRLHLETRQAADILLGQAASISVQVLK